MIIKQLIKLSNHLDSMGFTKEANRIDKIISIASDEYEPFTLGYDSSGGFYDRAEYYKKYSDSIRDDIISAFKTFDKSMLSDETKKDLKEEKRKPSRWNRVPFANRSPMYPSFQRTKNKKGYIVSLPYPTLLSEEELKPFVKHIEESGALKSHGGSYYQKGIYVEGGTILIQQVVEFKPVVEDINKVVRFLLGTYSEGMRPDGYEDLFE